jgi:hypothetical protein
MSSALAISGVTAVIQYLLNNIYNHPSTPLGNVRVSAQAPDVVQSIVGTGINPNLQVNVFLHQVTLNTAWRNTCLPSLAANGQTVLQNPPLALDLHYLLTAYASEDTQAEALLGYAVQMLHENPVLPRSQISTALLHVPASNPLSAVLGSSGLANQIEMIKITPATLGREELAWLWTALKADYRPTFPFQASVVLVLSPAPAVSALPVLQRGVSAQSGLLPPFPLLLAVEPPNVQPVACLGDSVSIQGSHLTGATKVLLLNPRIQNPLVPSPYSVVPAQVTPTSVQFTLPNDPANLPAGFYSLTVQIKTATDVLSTNSLPLVIAPKIVSGVPLTMASGPASLTVSCAPNLQAGQEVSLFIGGQEAPVNNLSATAISSPSFAYASLQSTTRPVPVWLRVDGADGPTLRIDPATKTPVFSAPMTQVT